jgi:hypothetical protein
MKGQIWSATLVWEYFEIEQCKRSLYLSLSRNIWLSDSADWYQFHFRWFVKGPRKDAFSTSVRILIQLFSVKMEAIAKVYEVKFVLNIAQLGEDDPLWRNVSYWCNSDAVMSYNIFSFSTPNIIGPDTKLYFLFLSGFHVLPRSEYTLVS